ncbi:MAG TPA: PAS domain S-box protein [Noviherbaspirillum sp.]
MHPSIDSRKAPDAAPILESITDAFFSLGEDWKFAYVNGQAEKLLGSPREALVGKDVWQAFPGLLGSKFEQLYRRVARDKVPETITEFYPDHARWYQVHAYPSEPGISVYFRDATEGVQAAEALRASEQRFRKMADSIPQIVWIVDGEGQGIFFNRQWRDYTGVPLDHESPENVSAHFVHPDDHLPTMQAWERAAREGKVFTVEHRIRSAAGEYRWFLVRAEPEFDAATGKILRWFGTSTDVHDRKLAEAAMKKNEARYRSVVQSIDDGFCIIQMLFDDAGRPVDYRFVEVNPTFERQTGLRHAQGKTARELAPDLEQHWFDTYGEVARSGKPIRFESESKVMERWFDVYAFRIDEPSTHHVALLFKDVTERRRFEQDMQQANRRKDEFLAMLAHELRNPLAPIGVAAELLRLAPGDVDRVRQSSDVISRQVRHITSLVDDLLDVSRVTRGLITLELAMLDLRSVVADAIEQTQPLIEARRHHFRAHLPPDAVMVRGDRKRLVQIVANLLNNAAKYTREGGRIDLSIAAEAQHVTLAVADNGIGMTPELSSRVFDLFAQGQRSSDRDQGGLGIGLALVKSLVELHGGTVAVHSAGLGSGSEFAVTLPRTQDLQDAQVGGGQDPVRVQTQGLRIMLVEDNRDAAQMLALLLCAAGHEVIVEHSSRRALERSRLERPAVCLIDIGLPDIDGHELARRLRKQEETAHSVLIAVTGYGQEQDRKNTAAAGFDHHFVKPVDTEALVQVLSGIDLHPRA